jgi:hypothetical protein
MFKFVKKYLVLSTIVLSGMVLLLVAGSAMAQENKAAPDRGVLAAAEEKGQPIRPNWKPSWTS